jgi:5-methylthioribose kinase
VAVKQALRKLRVKDDWYADVKRNHYEHEYIRYVSGIDPAMVPDILYYNDEEDFFAMEYLSDGFSTWKTIAYARDLIQRNSLSSCA